jgi:hypothetical protein
MWKTVQERSIEVFQKKTEYIFGGEGEKMGSYVQKQPYTNAEVVQASCL